MGAKAVCLHSYTSRYTVDGSILGGTYLIVALHYNIVPACSKRNEAFAPLDLCERRYRFSCRPRS